MTELEKLNQFVDEINNGGKSKNAIAYDSDYFTGAMNVRIAFFRNHRSIYNKLLAFCIENNLTIVKTTPATLETIVRVSTEEGLK